jgi:DNA-binding transcriptional regulator YiaG
MASDRSASGSAKRSGEGADEVIVREFQPERGVAVLEFNRQRVRYTREKTAEQVYAMADYLRARRGFSTDQQMAEVLGVHRSRLIAWKQGTELPNAANSQLLSHLAVVVQELEEFLDPDVIPDWLLTEQYTLAGRTPVDALARRTACRSAPDGKCDGARRIHLTARRGQATAAHSGDMSHPEFCQRAMKGDQT